MAGRNENSFTESLANFFTPNDGYSYSGGTLREDTPEGRGMGAAYTGGSYATNYGQFGQADSAGTGTNYQNITSSGRTRDTGPGYTPPTRIDPPPEAKNTGPMHTNPLIMGTIGAFSGGLPGLLLGAGSAKIRGGMYGVPQIDNTQGDDPKLVGGKAGASGYELKKRVPDSVTTEQIKKQLENDRRGIKTENRIEGSFYKDGDESKLFKLNRFGSSYEVDGYGHPNYGNSKQNRLDMEAGSDGSGGIAMVRRAAPITQATAPTSTLPAISTESEFAKQPMVSPPAEWLIANGYADTNPSYDALVKYNTDLRAGVLTMSEGGRLGQMQMQMGQMPRRGGISGQMGGLQQYGAYLDNRYGDPEFDQKRMQFLRDVNQQEQQTFGSGGGGSFPSSGLGGKGGAGIPNFDRITQEPVMFNEPSNELTTATNNTQLIENGFDNNIDPPEQTPTNSLYKGLSPVFGGAIGGARAALGMAEGGDVQFALGGNEKDLINAAERAVRNGLQAQGMARGGDMDISNEDKIAIAQYVKQYGKPALMQLVDSVRTGEADETRKRFASGENGEVRGNGDGSGTDDKVTAQLKDGDATQDVLLADGEFVLRKDAYEALKGAGVNVDKVNDAGSNAAKELNKMMTA